MKCNHCQSENVISRGTREREGEVYKRVKCKDCGKWDRAVEEYENVQSFVRTQVELEALFDPKRKRFIITSAQNDTPIDLKFWGAIQRWAKHYDAQVLVVPVLYRNPTLKEEASKDATWPAEVIPYMIENNVRIHENIRLMGHVRITATTVNPLTGLDTISRSDSAVFGHAQVQMKTVATPQKRLPKILTTTGSTSVANYSASKSGVKGEFHHSLGAVVIERDGDMFHLRNIVGDTNSEFYDLDLHVTDKKIRKARVEALVAGDTHVMFVDPHVKCATYTDETSMVAVLKPKYIVHHDLLDSYSISHHHRNRPAAVYKKHLNNRYRIEDELKQVADFLEETTPNNATAVVIPSNHHDHLSRWLEEVDWRTEPWNAKIYHQLWAAWLEAIDTRQPFTPFTHWLNANCTADVLYPLEDYPFTVKGIYLGYHGHRGPNGAKGSIQSMSKIGAKTVIGHYHSPAIEKGCYQVGTSSTLSLEYTSGPSSWLNSHCIIHPNGKRQIINIINLSWRLENDD